jgi:hypothetical protein
MEIKLLQYMQDNINIYFVLTVKSVKGLPEVAENERYFVENGYPTG